MAFKRSANIKEAKKKIRGDILLSIPFDWTDKQKELILLMTHAHTQCVFVEGPAGTGKSVCAMFSALDLLRRKKIEKIIYVRSVVESAQAHLGFLPGTKEDKTEEWFQTAFEACSNFLTPEELIEIKASEKIEFVPINFLRGRNFKNCVVLVEEAQNIVYKEHITILTRCADNCRIFVMGDSYQSDIKQPDQFSAIYEKLQDEEAETHGIFYREFDASDIKRSPLVQFIVERLEIYRK